MTQIANVGTETVPVDSLNPHPRNPNQGDVGAIAESIGAHGFYGHVIVQKSTRTILVGEHRWKAAKASGMEKIPVTWVDVDDEQALRIVLVDNRSSELAFRDPAGLVELLQELAATPQGFMGTGYDGDALDELLKDLTGDPLDPSPQLDKLEYRIVVECRGEEHQRELIERFEADGLTVKALTS